jgi:hypothetical protein
MRVIRPSQAGHLSKSTFHTRDNSRARSMRPAFAADGAAVGFAAPADAAAATTAATTAAIADEADKQAQDSRRRLRAVFDQPAHAEVGVAASVAAAVDTAARDAIALQATLGALVARAGKLLQQGGPVAAVLQADWFGAVLIARDTALRTKLAASHEKTRGAAGNGPVTQADFDAHDGVLLVYMGGLGDIFRAFRRSDPRAPSLIALDGQLLRTTLAPVRCAGPRRRRHCRPDEEVALQRRCRCRRSTVRVSSPDGAGVVARRCG